MKITQELVERIAHLARLTMTQEEKERMTVQLEDILGNMTALDKLNLEEEAQAHVRANVLRADEVEDSTDREALLSNASETDSKYILLPGTMGQGGRG